MLCCIYATFSLSFCLLHYVYCCSFRLQFPAEVYHTDGVWTLKEIFFPPWLSDIVTFSFYVSFFFDCAENLIKMTFQHKIMKEIELINVCCHKNTCLFYDSKEQPGCQLHLDEHTPLASSFCWEDERLQLLGLHNKTLISSGRLLTPDDRIASHLTTFLFLLSFLELDEKCGNITIFQSYSLLGISSKTLPLYFQQRSVKWAVEESCVEIGHNLLSNSFGLSCMCHFSTQTHIPCTF